jgi:[protein-PII] uridylyltransferase
VKSLNRQFLSTFNGSLKAFLDEENAVIRESHFAGATGNEVVQRRTALIDRTLREAHRRLAATAPMPALVAVGGYGRGELNPHSDIDIMFLCRDETDRKRAPELLYLLWDAGLDVGYSVRSGKECVSLARQDIKIRTSLIESRLIAGDFTLYQTFLKLMHSEVFYWKASAFINEKISERSATRRKYGGSIYLREPNVKEGAGGLRDFHTAFWIACVHFKVASVGELVRLGVITEGQFKVVLRSRNFLWTVRNEIHYLSGRKNDHLTFDLQERAAKDFNYRDSAHLLAVERFMKAYFLHARNIREFLHLVAETVLPKPVRRWFERTVSLGSFSLIGRTLVPASENDCGGGPAYIMNAFGIAQSRHAVFSDRLKAMIRECRIGDDGRRDPAASAVFLSILNNPDNLSETLELMKNARFLGRYLPEFRAVQALARHDYYHLYTVDEHILLAIRQLQGLWSGQFPALTSLRDAFKAIKKRWILNLAVLLHDLGKAYRTDHERHGGEVAEQILDRLGIVGEDHDRVVFLIRNHLLMSSLSQRRELSDRRVISDFSRVVRDRDNLAMLYLLTYADISAVNATAWTQWKAVLLQDLYLKTLNHLETSAQAVEEEQARLIAASVRIRSAAQGLFSQQDIDSFLVAMPDQYILYTSVHKVIDHIGMMKRLPDEQLVIQYRHYPEKGYTELTVCAYDAYGMFYRTAGTIAAKNLNILRAQVYTSKNGVMIDTFQVTDPEGNIYNYDDAWESVRRELRKALMSKIKPPEPGLYISVRQPPVTLTPSVEFDNETSDSFTIIDITARDMVGFLYRVTKTLYDLNLDIGSAKIVTEGVRVMDSFYVTDLLRQKITEGDRLQKIKETIFRVIE